MARVLTKCPECGQKISNRFECRHCGLLFNRYFEAQARKKEAEKARAARRSQNIFIFNTALSVFLVICLLGGGFYLWNSKEEPAPTAPPAITAPQTTAPAAEAVPEVTTPRRTAPQTSSNPVDIAVNGVSIVQSPWGVGTGFFIAEDRVLTTRNAVLYNEERLTRETEQLRQERIWLDEEPDRIRRLKERFEAEDDPEEKTELAEKIAKREQRLGSRTLKYQESEDVIARLTEDLQNVTIDIRTSDGRTFHMAYMNTSDTYDLALLTVYNTGIAPVKQADRSLEEGEQVYTLGRNNTSIKGTFTGYSEDGLIQSDTAIRQDYLGGPLVDEQGLVFGVSVMPPKEKRKTGLAVPIATVMREFGL